jgi:tRNA threonylcarbamoyladenosine biosynthesis protein TsaB
VRSPNAYEPPESQSRPSRSAASGAPAGERFVKVLAADTSSALGAVALLEDGRLAVEARVRLGKGHAEVLLPTAEALLRLGGRSLDELDLLCVGLGPGSFTGLRIGVVTFRMLAMALGLPIQGVSSLEALCVPWLGEDVLLVPTLDAYRGEVYAAVFRARGGRLERAAEDAAVRPEALAEQVVRLAEGEPLVLFGSGYDRHVERFAALPGTVLRLRGVSPSAEHVARLGTAMHALRPDTGRSGIVPSYVRKSDAELSRARREGG